LTMLSDHRKLIQVVPDDVKHMWNEWDLLGLIMIRLVSQITLTLLGNERKYNPRTRVRMALFAYLLALAVASSALGVITRTAFTKKKKGNSLSTLHFLKILENSLEVLNVLKNSLEMSADVARSHGGDGGGEDRPPPQYLPSGCGGCFANRGKGQRKPNLGGRAAGRLNTRDKTQNLSLKEITDKKGPVPIRFELRDKQILIPLGEHAAHWSSYIEEVIKGVPLFHPSWLKVPKERKATLIADIGTQFDLRPHMESPDWTEIHAGIQQHLQEVAQPLRSTRRSLTPSSWHTMLTGNSFGMRTDEEMKKLEVTGTYTDDEINRLARRVKQRGHIPDVGWVLPARAIASPISLGIVAGEGIHVEHSPTNIPQQQVAGETFPQRQVTGESPEMSLGNVVNVVVLRHSITVFALEDNEPLLRNFVEIVFQFPVALYIFLLSWPGCSDLPKLSVLVYLACFIKCFGRIKALRLAKTENLHDSMLGPPDAVITMLRSDWTDHWLQKLVSQLEILEEKLLQEDVNQKLLRSLSPEWNTHVVVWRNKDDLDTMSMDDLYNNLKVYEPKVKGMSS
nr:hypothetical protein CTI12_AA610890 [Tanacetum cinerariifolium]